MTDHALDEYCKSIGCDSYTYNPRDMVYKFHKVVTRKKGEPQCECEYCGKSKGWAYDDYLEVYACNYCSGKMEWDPEMEITEDQYVIMNQRTWDRIRPNYLSVYDLIDDFYESNKMWVKY